MVLKVNFKGQVRELVSYYTQTTVEDVADFVLGLQPSAVLPRTDVAPSTNALAT